MAKKTKNVEQAEQILNHSAQVKFSKSKILGMKQYANRVDMLQVLLRPDETYTLEAVNAAINGFMKGKVN